ncbi:MAG TPA: sel1 repeat family protein [Polyangiaceae bacterium]|nr:sel1 repeat family protein [Polyangiaceae bacterium]
MSAEPKTLDRDDKKSSLASPSSDPSNGDPSHNGPSNSIDELVALGDADGLIELGAMYRSGSATVPKDAFKAVECFEAASRLGSATAAYFVGVSFMNGRGVGKDIAEGAKRLRLAAQRGSLRAKVYVANLYEMGVHYAVDREKADVWYRNVARAAEINAEPTSDAHEVAMAELGCVRHCLQLVSNEALPTSDRAFYLKKAKAMGYGHRLAQARQGSVGEEATEDVAEGAPGDAETALQAEPDAPAEADQQANDEHPEQAEEAEEADAEPVAELGAQWTLLAGAAAFVVAASFAVAAFCAGWLTGEGSRALDAAGRTLPIVGRAHDLVFAVTLLLFGVVPASIVYRPNVVAIGATIGAGAAVGGWFLHASQPLLWSPAAQAGAFGLATTTLVLLVLGLLGGTRAARPKTPS